VPALVAGAAALLLLRLLPLASLALDAFGRRSRGLVLALAGWQLGRRAARNAGPRSRLSAAANRTQNAAVSAPQVSNR